MHATAAKVRKVSKNLATSRIRWIHWDTISNWRQSSSSCKHLTKTWTPAKRRENRSTTMSQGNRRYRITLKKSSHQSNLSTSWFSVAPLSTTRWVRPQIYSELLSPPRTSLICQIFSTLPWVICHTVRSATLWWARYLPTICQKTLMCRYLILYPWLITCRKTCNNTSHTRWCSSRTKSRSLSSMRSTSRRTVRFRSI